jgi:hypothetical protein
MAAPVTIASQPVYGLTRPKTPGGGIVLLEQHTAAASASLDFTTGITSEYDDYMIEIVSLLPATNAAIPYLRVSTNRGSSYDAGANYGWEVFNTAFASTSGGAAGSNTATQIQLFNGGQSSSYPMSMSLRFFDPLNASYRKNLSGSGVLMFSTGPNNYLVVVAATYNLTSAVDAFQLLYSTGNIASGTVRLYGLAR